MAKFLHTHKYLQYGPPTSLYPAALMTPHHAASFALLPTLVAVLLVTCTLLSQTPCIAAAHTDCPRLCECKWKSGKESVLCLNANLTGLPPSLDAGTQVLDLTGNEVATIHSDAFSRANLLNLQKLFLAKCRLRSIDRFAFRKLINLVELDLSYNVLTIIPTHAFDSTPEMRELKIVGNPIQVVSNDAFFNVPQLVRLELSDCRLAVIAERAFAGLEMTLEWLKLDGNRLVDVASATLTSLHNLHGLELAGNPWNCTCALRPLRQWMLRENIPYGIPPVCKNPMRLANKSWEKIELDDFACVPEIEAMQQTLSAVEGRNVTLVCTGKGSPEPHISWTTRNRVIANVSDAIEYPTTTAGKGRKLYIAQRNFSQITLTVVNVELHDVGVFACSAENRAGKVEAGITLSVQRKPPESTMSQRLLVACAISAALLAVVSICLVFCLCSVRRKRQIRWNKQPQRSESYEKIEMSSNSEGHQRATSDARGECSFAGKPYGENGISVVGRKNGNYRTVPSEDDGTGYEDNVEGAPDANRLRKKQPPRIKETSFQIAVAKPEATDLHIPRLIDFCDNAPDSGSSSLNGGQFETTKSNHNSPTIRSSIMLYTKPTWNQQSNGNGHHRRTSNESSYRQTTNLGSSDHKDPMYPDLLDISSLSVHPLTHQNSISRNIENSTQSGGAFCTFPRQRTVVQRASGISNQKVSVSDSQSLLLQSDGGMSSRYGSDGLESANSRRMSEESYVNFPPVHLINQMSQSQSNCKTILTQSRKQNPSLPTSPSKDVRAQTAFGIGATPLLDFKQLTSNLPGGGIDPMPSPSASTNATTNAYDYHAAQLERFLEEYRNLQKQLCKMKETCDSIRMKEVPTDRQHDGTLGQSVKCADPVMYSAATSLTGSPVKLMDEAIHSGSPASHRKGLLKSANPRQPPDPPPYWLHRNAMLKRLQDPAASTEGAKEFFPKS